MKRVLLGAVSALCLAVCLPIAPSFAQTTTTSTAVSGSESESNSASVAGAVNEGNTTTITFEGAEAPVIPRERQQAPGVALVTPPGSSNSCADTLGAGGSAPAVGVVVNVPIASDRCNAREDARLMLANAQAAEAVMGRGAGTVDVLAARARLSQIDDNGEAYAAARAELASQRVSSVPPSIAPASTAGETQTTPPSVQIALRREVQGPTQ